MTLPMFSPDSGNYPLPDWIKRSPKTGEGVNVWLLTASLWLLDHGYNQNEVGSILRLASSGCGRPVKVREISRAISKAIVTLGSENGVVQVSSTSEKTVAPAHQKWPEIDESKLQEVCQEYGGVEELVKYSKHDFKNDRNRCKEILSILFPNNPLICIGKSVAKCATLPLIEWMEYELEKLQYIVPSPMKSPQGKTLDGKVSVRCLGNTGSRHFLIIECDQGTKDQQAALLLHLKTMAPLVLVVDSGGKSLHGWFYCFGQSEDLLRSFMEYAVSLGADPRTWTLCQFVRLPDGLRDNGNRQSILYSSMAVTP